MADLSKMTHQQKIKEEKLDSREERQEQLLNRMWAVSKLKLFVVVVIAVVVGGIAIVVENQGDTIQRLNKTVQTFDLTVDEARNASIEARSESRAARAELQEAIRLVQENPQSEGFTERVEAALVTIAEVDERLERIEALLQEGEG